ncbi:hypothetical protein [Methylovulum psychrotolerans]|uniref:Uncharacterized protein n=2 Tax=Methylovulum psychrotolerans TaxID=1704499 RepID=A0A2S5CND9_9GAMM|nr:hypothetical protein [Methylovulum psychrotolerans]POZ52333.1 hypothetical protein AADEFJLK_01814 [Methylovulum psychrotolerans]
MKEMPEARYSERLFLLGYVAWKLPNGLRSSLQIRGVGFMYRVGKKLKEQWGISLLDEEWMPCDNFFYSDMEYPLLVADVFLNIKTADWVGVHPAIGTPLYGKPRTRIERLHRRRLREFNALKHCLRTWGKSEVEYWCYLKQNALLEQLISSGHGCSR